MGRRGPAPRSPKAKALRGDRKARPVLAPPELPASIAGEPAPPGWIDPTSPLGGRVLAEWLAVVGELRQLGTLSETDRATLDLYARTFALLLRAEDAIASLGFVIETALGGSKANPALATSTKAASLLRGLLSDLGLSPAARLRRSGDGPPPADAFADFLAASDGPRPA